MAWSNIALTITAELEDVVQTNIGDVKTEKVAAFPEDDEIQAFIAGYGRAVLFRLVTDEPGTQGSDGYNERLYQYELLVVADDRENRQDDITSLTEQVKYYYQQNRTNGTVWQNIEIGPIEYQVVENQSNLKTAIMPLTVLRDG